jgi:hypothetical protein
VPQIQSNTNSNEFLKRYLAAVRLNKDLTKDEMIMLYWIIEAVNLRIDIKKEELDKIIDAKNVPLKEGIM